MTNLRDATWTEVRLRSEGVRSVSPNGVLGDPDGATAAEGRRLLEQAAADCVATLNALLSAGPPR